MDNAKLARLFKELVLGWEWSMIKWARYPTSCKFDVQFGLKNVRVIHDISVVGRGKGLGLLGIRYQKPSVKLDKQLVPLEKHSPLDKSLFCQGLLDLGGCYPWGSLSCFLWAEQWRQGCMPLLALEAVVEIMTGGFFLFQASPHCKSAAVSQWDF